MFASCYDGFMTPRSFEKVACVELNPRTKKGQIISLYKSNHKTIIHLDWPEQSSQSFFLSLSLFFNSQIEVLLFFFAQKLCNLASEPRLVKCRCGYSGKAGSRWAATLENTAGLQVGSAGHFSVLRCPTEPDPASRIHGNTVQNQSGVSFLFGTHGTIGLLGCVRLKTDVIGGTSRPLWTGSPMNGLSFFFSLSLSLSLLSLSLSFFFSPMSCCRSATYKSKV